jgi:uncharacterized LabA/DUF88 family protein
MKEGTDTLAVLIDGDNVSSKVISGLLTEIANYGVVSVKRIYGDWTAPTFKGWKECLLEHSIQPMQQFAYTKGKNATDGAMIIDAMDLLYTGRFSGFCIVSSDSDFARLALRLREQGVRVYGFGERKTPRPFITACNKFIYFDVFDPPIPEPDNVTVSTAQKTRNPFMLAQSEPTEAKGVVKKTELNKATLNMLAKAIDASADEDGFAYLGLVGSHLVKQAPDFDPRNFGFSRLSELAEASGIVDIVRTGEGLKIFKVKLKSFDQKN